jgi:hypothetical protein
MVAPLRYGAGIKGKLGTSMSHGVPCVATPLAAEGMELIDGRHVLIADTPHATVDAIVQLYTEPILWNRLSTNGLQFVRDHYSFENGQRIMQGLLTRIGLDTAVPGQSARRSGSSAATDDLTAARAKA